MKCVMMTSSLNGFTPSLSISEMKERVGVCVREKKWGSCGLVVQRLSGMQEVPCLNPLGAIMCAAFVPRKTINRGPNTPLPTTHTLIFEESKDPGIPPKVVP